MKSANPYSIVRSFAKVNLTLDVLGKRLDGCHDIESVMSFISLHDVITVSVGGEPGIRIECDMPGIPTDERNLAYKAAAMFFDVLGATPRVDIRIEKSVPPEAGLGGGSSNGAAVLGALGKLSGDRTLNLSRLGRDLPPAAGSRPGTAECGRTLNLEPRTLNPATAAARIGSDLTFFVSPGTKLVTERGEETELLPDVPNQWMLILKPPFGVSTAWAYRRLDEMRASGRAPDVVGKQETASARMSKCIRAHEWARIPELLSNDLELPGIEEHREIRELKEGLLRAGASGALMCGSGSAVFGLFPSRETARQAEATLSGKEVQAFVAKTLTRREAEDVSIEGQA